MSTASDPTSGSTTDSKSKFWHLLMIEILDDSHTHNDLIITCNTILKQKDNLITYGICNDRIANCISSENIPFDIDSKTIHTIKIDMYEYDESLQQFIKKEIIIAAIMKDIFIKLALAFTDACDIVIAQCPSLFNFNSGPKNIGDIITGYESDFIKNFIKFNYVTTHFSKYTNINL